MRKSRIRNDNFKNEVLNTEKREQPSQFYIYKQFCLHFNIKG